jgi:hypothetical protein
MLGHVPCSWFLVLGYIPPSLALGDIRPLFHPLHPTSYLTPSSSSLPLSFFFVGLDSILTMMCAVFFYRVQLDREGPIYDFAWNPSGKEFGIIYGCELSPLLCSLCRTRTHYAFNADMPAKAMLFDQKVRPVHDFGSSPVNFISFNPSGRLLALAGFGNLAGEYELGFLSFLFFHCPIRSYSHIDISHR